MRNEVLRTLVVDAESVEANRERQASLGQTTGESYRNLLVGRFGVVCDVVRPTDATSALPAGSTLGDYDAVFVSGSSLHFHEDNPDTRALVEFVREVFASGTPGFGSCAGLQIAVVAAGGTVAPAGCRQESGIAWAINRTTVGDSHDVLTGRDSAYDALSVHDDEVVTLPPVAEILASNAKTRVQAAELRHGEGLFVGVQYHPELTPAEVASSLRRQAGSATGDGAAALGAQVALLDGLVSCFREDPVHGRHPDLTDPARRTLEIGNFLRGPVRTTMATRGRRHVRDGRPILLHDMPDDGRVDASFTLPW